MLLLFSFQLWKYKTDGPMFSSPAIWNWFHETYESICRYKQMPAGPSSNINVYNMEEPDVSDSCDKHNNSRIQKEDTIEHELSIDIIDENAVISHNYNENVIFGSHDSSVYCVSNQGKLVWKNDAESPVYSTPFSGLVTIKGKCNDHSNTNCLKEAKVVERIPDEPNILIDQNSIVESDEKGILIGDKCLNPNTLGMVKTPQSFDHSEFIRVEGAENLVNEPSIANEQNCEIDPEEITEGGKYTADDNEKQNIKIKGEAINEYRSIDVKNDAVDNENHNIDVKTEDVDKRYQNIDVKLEAINEYQSIDKKNDAFDNEYQNIGVKTEDVDNVHLNSFLTDEDVDSKHQNYYSDVNTEDVGNEYLNVDVKSESVVQNIGVRQKAFDQNNSVKSDTSEESNVSNSDIDKTQSVVIVTFATTKGIIYVVGAEDGQVLCKTQMEGEVFSSPILYRNSLVVGCRDDNVYCFDIDIS